MTRRPALPACDAPPPDAGRVHSPAHPLYGIAFLYVVAETLLWGARAGGSSGTDSWARVAIAHAGLGVCLIGAVHFIEAVDLRHVLGKLGALRAPSAETLASWPAWVALGLGLVHPVAGVVSRQGLPAVLLAAALAAVWQEGFYRGFVFRALMRRHGFALSGAIAALLLVGDGVLLGTQLGARQGGIVLRGLLELPLSLALCSLFWLRQSLASCVLVRFAVLAAAAVSGAVWPAGAVALLLWILQRLRNSTRR